MNSSAVCNNEMQFFYDLRPDINFIDVITICKEILVCEDEQKVENPTD